MYLPLHICLDVVFKTAPFTLLTRLIELDSVPKLVCRCSPQSTIKDRLVQPKLIVVTKNKRILLTLSSTLKHMKGYDLYVAG